MWSTCWRSTRAPPHRAVRQQGDRRAAGAARGAGRWPAGRWPSWASPRRRRCDGFFVKEAVLPFQKFPGADVLPGPGDALDRRGDGPRRALRPRLCQGPDGAPATPLPLSGAALLTVNDFDKGAVGRSRATCTGWASRCMPRAGTAAWLTRAGLPVRRSTRSARGSPHIADLIDAGEVQLIDQHAARRARLRRQPASARRRSPRGDAADDAQRRGRGSVGDPRAEGERAEGARCRSTTACT